MTNKDALRRLLDYTVWANHRIVRAAIPVSIEDFVRTVGGSHGSLRGALVHMYGAEWIWLERWKGASPTAAVDEAEFADLLALRERWTALEEERDRWFDELADDGVSRRIAYRTVAGKQNEAPLWQLVQHVANHSSYHRGQVTVLLRLLGATPVGTDMVSWDRETAKARRREAEAVEPSDG